MPDDAKKGESRGRKLLPFREQLNSYDVLNEREVLKACRCRDGALEESGYNIRLYTLPELRSMLSDCDMELLQVWGDFDGSAYSVRSRRMITLSRKSG